MKVEAFPSLMQKISEPELILGIRNLAGLEACSRYADAVYFSTDRLSLRAKAKEITLETLGDFVHEVKARGLKAYLAVNSAVNEARLEEVEEVIDAAVKAGVDAVIAWDPAVILKARKAGLSVQISTQANVTNHETAEFYRTLGAERIVFSRELSLEEIRKIRQQTEIKSKPLFTARCVWQFREGATFRHMSSENPETAGNAPSPAAGNGSFTEKTGLLWKAGGNIFSVQKIYV